MFTLVVIIVFIMLLAVTLKIIKKVLINLDYAFILVFIWLFVFGANGFNKNALLFNYEIHTVFVILTHLVVIGVWHGLQQITIFNIYVFRIIACAFSACLFTYFVSNGLFGRNIADGMDTIWKVAVGITYFSYVLWLRARDNSLMHYGQID